MTVFTYQLSQAYVSLIMLRFLQLSDIKPHAQACKGLSHLMPSHVLGGSPK